MSFPSRLTLLVVGMAVAASSLAWNDHGHMAVASIAERQLTFATKQNLLKLLAIGGTPKTNELLTSACWADDTKNKENGPWHYINHHFRTDGKPTTLGPAPQNVVWAIQRFSDVLKNRGAADAERADALRYLMHFVGDIHMPLHCVARDTDAFPEGDRGGNEFKIVPPAGFDPAPRNLHFLWDMGGGLFTQIERPLDSKGRDAVSETAELAIKLNPDSKLRAELAVTDPHAWSREGLALAKKYVYGLSENAAPGKEYLEQCQQVSLRQIALAGYRLGILLNRLLDGETGPS